MQSFDIAAQRIGIIGDGPASTNVLRRFAKLNIRTLVQCSEQTNDDQLEHDLAEYQQVMYVTNPTRSYGIPVIVMKEGEVVERFDKTKLIVDSSGFFVLRGDVRLNLSSITEPTVLILETLSLTPVPVG